jgi:mRNA-degrading endonuclease RelE of RelBE toxin-antitoxin system
MAHAVIWSPTARRKLTDTLPESVAAAVWEFVNGALAEDPRRVGKPLRYDLEGLWSARRGEYRVLYQIDQQTVTVLVVTVDHRRGVYRRH